MRWLSKFGARIQHITTVLRRSRSTRMAGIVLAAGIGLHLSRYVRRAYTRWRLRRLIRAEIQRQLRSPLSNGGINAWLQDRAETVWNSSTTEGFPTEPLRIIYWDMTDNPSSFPSGMVGSSSVFSSEEMKNSTEAGHDTEHPKDNVYKLSVLNPVVEPSQSAKDRLTAISFASMDMMLSQLQAVQDDYRKQYATNSEVLSALDSTFSRIWTIVGQAHSTLFELLIRMHGASPGPAGKTSRML
jgi:hypothetical protein